MLGSMPEKRLKDAIHGHFSAMIVGSLIVITGYLSSINFGVSSRLFEAVLFGFFISAGILMLDDYVREVHRNNNHKNENNDNKSNKDVLSLKIGIPSMLFAGAIIGTGQPSSIMYFIILALLTGAYLIIKYRSIYASLLKSVMIGMLIICGASIGGIGSLSIVLAILASMVFFAAEITWEIGRGYEKYRDVSIPAYFGERESGIIISVVMFGCMFLMLLSAKLGIGINVYRASIPAMIFAYCGYKMLIDAEKFANEVYLLERIGALVALVMILFPKILLIVG